MNEREKQDLIAYRLKRARETKDEVDFLINNRLWNRNTAINRMYYSCFYTVLALLLKYNVEDKTHAGVRQKFGLHFIKTGKVDQKYGRFFADLFDKRLTGDYDNFIDFGEADAKALKPVLIEFLEAIEALIDKY